MRAIIRIEVMGSFLASSVEAPEAKLVIAHFSLILHTQENSGERDKESSLVIWNSRSGAMLTRNLKSNIHPPKLFHGGFPGGMNTRFVGAPN